MTAEIEVKYLVGDVVALERVLVDAGIRLSPALVQDDQAYAPVGWSGGDSRIGVTFVRLRTEGERCTFTTKTPVANVLACREFETVVADRDQMHKAVLAMGYRATVRVKKQRRTARVGRFELCIDEVEGVGDFLEVEAISDTGDMVGLQAELAAWVDALGVPVERTGATYDQIVSERSTAVQPAVQ